MGTIQKSFEIALKKGDIGERIIMEYLHKKGWICYTPFKKDRAHYFDLLATRNKNDVIAIDVKTKARLNKWNAQGINKTSYNQYLNFVKRTNVDFYLIFIDDKTGEVNASNITKLKNPIYPNDEIIAWNLNDMKQMFTITKEQIDELTKYDQRNYKFNPDN